MFKKIFSLLLTVLMALSVLNFTSFAASDWEITFDLTSDGKNKVFSTAGETVEVQFSIIRTDIDSSYLFSTFTAAILFDRNFFEYEPSSARLETDYGAVKKIIRTSDSNFSFEVGRLPESDDYYKGSVVFCTLSLKIKNDATGSGKVWFDAAKLMDNNIEPVLLNCKSLEVIIKEPTQVNFKVGDEVNSVDTDTGKIFGEIKPENPTAPAGYKFDCWTLNGNPVSDDYEITGGETFVAKFSPDFKVEVYNEFVNGYALVIAYGNEAGAYTFNMNSVKYDMYRTAHYDDSEITYAHAFVLRADADFDKEDAFELISYDANATANVIEIKTTEPDLNTDGFVGIYDVGAIYYSWTADVTKEMACANYATYVERLLNSDLNPDKGIDADDVTVVTGYSDFRYSAPQS